MENFDQGKIDFSMRIYGINNRRPEFYIHPTGKDGQTIDFRVTGNTLERIMLTNKKRRGQSE